MATLSSAKVASTVQPRIDVHSDHIIATFTPTAALGLADVIQMVKIAAGSTITDVTLAASGDLDVGASTLRVSVGDGNDPDRFILANAVGSAAAGVARLDAATGLGYTYTSDDTIDITVTAAAGAGVPSASYTLCVSFTAQQ